MKPRLKPMKGWRYRVIVCDWEGRYEFDDVVSPDLVVPIAQRLIDRLREK